MCGIAGLATCRGIPERGTLERMADRIRHRGPDEEGFLLREGCGLAHRRLMRLIDRPWLTVLLSAAFYASVHVEDLRLLARTFGAGLVWSSIYRRVPNIIALGLSHGVLGAVTYPLLLGDNPLNRM